MMIHPLWMRLMHWFNALAAIQSTIKPVSVVARDNGYMCPSRFTARFQERFGITPRTLRRASKL